MSFDRIFGHKKQIEFLNKSIQMGKLSHAFVFSGPAFVGKRLVAQRFAQTLLCERNSACGECGQCKTFIAQSNADFLMLGTDESIKIEQVRELIYKLALKPYQAKYKVAVIDNAENMTVEAQNSLLKVLEEPKSYTIIILITANPGKLLRTISSRALKINFGPVEAVDYADLIPSKVDEETKNLILTLAAGRPGLAASISTDEGFVEKIKQINLGFNIVMANDLAEKLRLAYDLADLETADLKQALDFWLIKFEQGLKQSPNIKNARNLSRINQARKDLDQNVNSKLVLTNLMLNLA